MTTQDFKNLLLNKTKSKNKFFKRLFFGRGNYYKNYSYLNVDSIDDLLFISLYEKITEEDYDILVNIFLELSEQRNFQRVIIQKRYLKDNIYDVIKGNIKDCEIVIENNMKFSIEFKNQNIGFFPDMKEGRDYIKSISKDKNVLNLFSYTCAFSVAACLGGTKRVVNVDMSKASLAKGKENHILNEIDLRNVKFLPFNILKSWSKIKKFAPYDIIIIDPPSFQKGSFIASNDYAKILKRLDSLSDDNCTVLSCLNAPELNEDFLITLFKEHASNFIFEKRLNNCEDFPSGDNQKDLKNMLFKKNIT